MWLDWLHLYNVHLLNPPLRLPRLSPALVFCLGFADADQFLVAYSNELDDEANQNNHTD